MFLTASIVLMNAKILLVILMTVFGLQLLFSLHHYDGDDRIKDFIFDLVSSTVDGQEKDYRNHTGTCAVTSYY